MNQILVTETIFMTPELRRKKKLYKINFFLSVFLVCSLFSYYIYAEYDRNKNEEISQEILANIELIQDDSDVDIDDTTIKVEDNVLVVVLDEKQSNRQEIDVTSIARDAEEQIKNKSKEKEIYTAPSGDTYSTDSILNIPSLEINYPVLSKTTDELLKISLTKFWGPEPNKVGNYVVVGHNYKNKKMFGKLSSIQNGDIIEITDLKGKTVKYEVYNKFTVTPDDTSCTTQKTNGKREITLITCTNYGQQRLVIKAKEVK